MPKRLEVGHLNHNVGKADSRTELLPNLYLPSLRSLLGLEVHSPGTELLRALPPGMLSG